MAALGTPITLADWAKRKDPSGKTSKIVELLEQTNEILTDAVFTEGNLETGHRTTVRTGLPTVAWRQLNQGVAKSKSTTAQIDEACAILEARSEVDVDIVQLNGNTQSFRLSEAKPFVEAMNQELAATMFYGNSDIAPEEFTGLSVRYSSLSAENGQNIIDAAGTGADLSSIYLVCWGEPACMIFPKGSMAGLLHEDLGVGDAFDSNNNRFRAYMDRWQWKAGIAVKDWRYIARIANIDISNLVAKSSAADLIEDMISAIHAIPGGYAGLKMGKPVFYMSRTCFKMLDIQRRDDVITGGGLSYDKVDGMAVPNFRGIPVRICDALLETEDQVV